MNATLSRRQLAWMGFLVLVVVGAATAGLMALATKQGWGEPRCEYQVLFPDAHDIGPGTAVRLKGLEAGQVLAVEYPTDPAEPGVLLRLSLRTELARHLRQGATAEVYSTSLLGQKVIALHPGPATAPPLVGTVLQASTASDLGTTLARVATLAEETTLLMRQVRSQEGTIGQLLHNDGLYRDLQALVRRADRAVSVVEVQRPNGWPSQRTRPGNWLSWLGKGHCNRANRLA